MLKNPLHELARWTRRRKYPYQKDKTRNRARRYMHRGRTKHSRPERDAHRDRGARQFRLSQQNWRDEARWEDPEAVFAFEHGEARQQEVTHTQDVVWEHFEGDVDAILDYEDHCAEYHAIWEDVKTWDPIEGEYGVPLHTRLQSSIFEGDIVLTHDGWYRPNGEVLLEKPEDISGARLDTANDRLIFMSALECVRLQSRAGTR